MLTRLAPSPTGALHLGNARTFMVNWAVARQRGWRIVLRIEDLDGPRVKKGADRMAIEDLVWLGIDWDEGPVYQSARAAVYDRAVDRLLEMGLAYPCICTRREVDLAASAPHAEDGASIYPGTCRGRFASVEEARRQSGREPAIRFHLPEGIIEFDDGFLGRRRCDAAKELGDFVIRKADGTAAYQLAVVIDDADLGVTHIVRGDDLLDSTPRQIALYRALNREASIPQYIHLPLIVGPDGRRLAKRHGDTRLATYRQGGMPSSEILQQLASWSGIARPQNIQSAEDFAQAFKLDNCPAYPIVLGRA
jgi:glutamyl-tRNA synthetase